MLALWCCVAAPALGEVGIGNLVFVDANGNGVADAGEGRAGVTVQLFQDGQSPTVAAPTAEMETDENGFFLFDVLSNCCFFASSIISFKVNFLSFNIGNSVISFF